MKILKALVQTVARWLWGLIAAVSLLLHPAVGMAADDGWTYANGLWYHSGVAYTEEKYQEAYTAYYPDYYDAYGCYRKGAAYTAYRWKTYYKRVTIVPGPNAISQAFAIAAGRDKVEGQIRLQASETQQAIAIARALGLEGNFRWNDYGLNPYAPVYYSQLQTGSTLYKTDVAQHRSATQVEATGQLDLNALALILDRYGERAQSSATLVGQGLNGNLERAIAANAANQADANRVAFVVAVLNAVRPDPKITVRTEQSSVSPVMGAPVPSSPAAVPLTQQDLDAFRALPVVQGCLKCHGQGGANQGSFDLSRYHPRVGSVEVKRAIARYAAGATKCTGAKLKVEDLPPLIVEVPMPAAKE